MRLVSVSAQRFIYRGLVRLVSVSASEARLLPLFFFIFFLFVIGECSGYFLRSVSDSDRETLHLKLKPL